MFVLGVPITRTTEVSQLGKSGHAELNCTVTRMVTRMIIAWARLPYGYC